MRAILYISSISSLTLMPFYQTSPSLSTLPKQAHFVIEIMRKCTHNIFPHKVLRKLIALAVGVLINKHGVC